MGRLPLPVCACFLDQSFLSSFFHTPYTTPHTHQWTFARAARWPQRPWVQPRPQVPTKIRGRPFCLVHDEARRLHAPPRSLPCWCERERPARQSIGNWRKSERSKHFISTTPSSAGSSGDDHHDGYGKGDGLHRSRPAPRSKVHNPPERTSEAEPF